MAPGEVVNRLLCCFAGCIKSHARENLDKYRGCGNVKYLTLFNFCSASSCFRKSTLIKEKIASSLENKLAVNENPLIYSKGCTNKTILLMDMYVADEKTIKIQF